MAGNMFRKDIDVAGTGRELRGKVPGGRMGRAGTSGGSDTAYAGGANKDAVSKKAGVRMSETSNDKGRKKSETVHDKDRSYAPSEGAAGDICAQLADISAQIEKMNLIVVTEKAGLSLYSHPGRSIPVAANKSGFRNKLATVFKKMVRKSTRFITDDLKEHNDRIDHIVDAMEETQMQLLRLIDVLQDYLGEE